MGMNSKNCSSVHTSPVSSFYRDEIGHFVSDKLHRIASH